MARLGLIQKNKNNIKLVEKYADRRAKLKEVIKNRELSLQERYVASVKLSKLPRRSSKICLVNRCEISGRSRGVYRKRFGGLSRIVVRKFASLGLLNGVLKA